MNESNSGMMTKIWGPAGWLFLHCVVMGYPSVIDKNNKEHLSKMNQMKIFLITLGDVLPCNLCRDSYKKFINELPVDNHLSTRKKLAKWLYDIHNKVNYKLDIKDYPSFESVYERYEGYRAKCKKTVKTKGCVHPKYGSPQKCVIKIEDDFERMIQGNNNFEFKGMKFRKCNITGDWMINM